MAVAAGTIVFTAASPMDIAPHSCMTVWEVGTPTQRPTGTGSTMSAFSGGSLESFASTHLQSLPPPWAATCSLWRVFVPLPSLPGTLGILASCLTLICCDPLRWPRRHILPGFCRYPYLPTDMTAGLPESSRGRTRRPPSIPSMVTAGIRG